MLRSYCLQDSAGASVLNEADDLQLGPIPGCGQGDLSSNTRFAAGEWNGTDPCAHDMIMREAHSDVFSASDLGHEAAFGNGEVQFGAIASDARRCVGIDRQCVVRR